MVKGHLVLWIIVVRVLSLLSVDTTCCRLSHIKHVAVVLRYYPYLANVLQLTQLNGLKAQL